MAVVECFFWLCACVFPAFQQGAAKKVFYHAKGYHPNRTDPTTLLYLFVAMVFGCFCFFGVRFFFFFWQGAAKIFCATMPRVGKQSRTIPRGGHPRVRLGARRPLQVNSKFRSWGYAGFSLPFYVPGFHFEPHPSLNPQKGTPTTQECTRGSAESGASLKVQRADICVSFTRILGCMFSMKPNGEVLSRSHQSIGCVFFGGIPKMASVSLLVKTNYP